MKRQDWPLSLLERIDYSYCFPIEDGWRHLYPVGVSMITGYALVAHMNGQQEPEIDHAEHDRRRWCRLSEALELLTWPYNMEALKLCNRVMRTRG